MACVDPVLAAGCFGVDPLEVEAPLDLAELAHQVEPRHQVLVVEELQLGVVAADLLVGGAPERPHVVGRVPDVAEVVRRRGQRMAAVVGLAVEGTMGVDPAVGQDRSGRGWRNRPR